LTKGVVFEDLTVKGFGGAKFFIKTFPNAFIDFFNVYGTLKSLFGKKKGIEFDILKDFTGCVRPGEVFLPFDEFNVDVTRSWRSRQWLHHISPSNGKSAQRIHRY
jgi:hypothetical protein